MQNKVKWGVVGAGGIARRRTIPEGIVPASNAALVAVFDRSPETDKQVAEQFHAQAVNSFAELLAEEIDAVYIATPVRVHHEQVLACARAGKHVLCEKPLGITVAEAEEAIAACREARVQLGCAFMMRFQSQHQKALHIIRDGTLGQPVYGRAQLSCWYPPMEGAWRQDPNQGGGWHIDGHGGPLY